MSDLVGNPNCWFSYAKAHIIEIEICFIWMHYGTILMVLLYVCVDLVIMHKCQIIGALWHIHTHKPRYTYHFNNQHQLHIYRSNSQELYGVYAIDIRHYKNKPMQYKAGFSLAHKNVRFDSLFSNVSEFSSKCPLKFHLFWQNVPQNLPVGGHWSPKNNSQGKTLIKRLLKLQTMKIFSRIFLLFFLFLLKT